METRAPGDFPIALPLGEWRDVTERRNPNRKFMDGTCFALGFPWNRRLCMRKTRRLTTGERWELGLFLTMVLVACLCLTTLLNLDSLPQLFAFTTKSSGAGMNAPASQMTPKQIIVPPVAFAVDTHRCLAGVRYAIWAGARDSAGGTPPGKEASGRCEDFCGEKIPICQNFASAGDRLCAGLPVLLALSRNDDGFGAVRENKSWAPCRSGHESDSDARLGVRTRVRERVARAGAGPGRRD